MSQQRKTSSISHSWAEMAHHSRSGAVLMRKDFPTPECYHSGWLFGGKSQGTPSPGGAWGFTSVAPISTNGCSPHSHCPLTDGGTDKPWNNTLAAFIWVLETEG